MTEPLGAECVDQEIDSHDVRFHAEAFERIERFDRYRMLAQNSARVEIRNDAMETQTVRSGRPSRSSQSPGAPQPGNRAHDVCGC